MIVLNFERTRAAVWFAFDSGSLKTGEPICLGIVRGPLKQPALEEARAEWGKRGVTLLSFAEVMAALGESSLNPHHERES